MASEAQRAIEAILMVSDVPVEPHLLAQLLEVSPGRIEELCDRLAAEYRDADRGFSLARVAGGYRFQSHADLAPYVERFVLEGQSARLSTAALETLAIVAYKQPVSRAQVAAIRGVNADGVMRTLVQRGFVTESGRDPGPGQAVLYSTTSLFLERMGLDRVEDLPPLAGFVPGAEVMEALEHSLRTDTPDPPNTPSPATGEAATATGDGVVTSPGGPAGTPGEPPATGLDEVIDPDALAGPDGGTTAPDERIGDPGPFAGRNGGGPPATNGDEQPHPGTSRAPERPAVDSDGDEGAR
jgi:segregation and condensation protein B